MYPIYCSTVGVMYSVIHRRSPINEPVTLRSQKQEMGIQTDEEMEYLGKCPLGF